MSTVLLNKCAALSSLPFISVNTITINAHTGLAYIHVGVGCVIYIIFVYHLGNSPIPVEERYTERVKFSYGWVAETKDLERNPCWNYWSWCDIKVHHTYTSDSSNILPHQTLQHSLHVHSNQIDID